MDDDFKQAIVQLLQDEGSAFTDDPDDPGGKTKYGITHRFLNTLGFSTLKVETLTEEDATNLYYTYFWKEYQFDVIAMMHGPLAQKMFNFCVNAGPDPAFRCLQRALRACGVSVKEDGVMGPITRGGLYNYLLPPDNRVQVACVLVAYRSEIAGYYRDLDKPKYENGWVARAYRV